MNAFNNLEEIKGTSMSSTSPKKECTNDDDYLPDISGLQIKFTDLTHENNDKLEKHGDDDNEGLFFPYQKANVSRFFSDKDDEENIKPKEQEHISLGRRSTQMNSDIHKIGKFSGNVSNMNPGNSENMLFSQTGTTQSGFISHPSTFMSSNQQFYDQNEQYFNLPNSKTSLISNAFSNINLNHNELRPEYVLRPPTQKYSSTYPFNKLDMHQMPKSPTHNFSKSPQLSNPSVRAVNRAHTNEMISNINQHQFPIMTPTAFQQPYYAPMYLQVPYNYPVEMMPPQIPYYQTIQNLHGFKESSGASSKLSSSTSGNQSSEISKKTKNRQGFSNSSINYNYMTIEEIQKCLPHLCKEQLGCRFLQTKVESIPNYAEKYILPVIFNNLLEIILDQFGNYLIQKILDTISLEMQSSIYNLVSLYNINFR